MGRGKYDFSEKTKQIAISKSGYGPDEEVEVHHRISVSVAKALGLSAYLISSVWNAVVMLKSEHRELHRRGGMGEEHSHEAEQMQPRLFD
jgi:hypothetical protein